MFYIWYCNNKIRSSNYDYEHENLHSIYLNTLMLFLLLMFRVLGLELELVDDDLVM